MKITVILTEQSAALTGTAAVTREYVGENVKFIPCLEDLLAVSGLTGRDVVQVLLDGEA